MNAAWQSGQLWGTLGASWTSAFLKSGAPDTAGLWNAYLLPQWEAGDATSGSWGGGGIAVFKSSEHPYEAAQFIKWALTDPEPLSLNNANAGVFPATVTALDDVENLQLPDPFFGGQRIWEVFAQSAADLNYNWLWGPAMVATDAAVSDGVTAAIQGRGTLLEALESAQEETLKVLDSQGITVVE
jgi:multiple sugar transport system substrate-binding protein